MTYTVTATRGNGEWLHQQEWSTAPTLEQAARFGEDNLANYVSSRHGHAITCFARNRDGTWRILVADVPAPVAVELRRVHHETEHGGVDRR